MSSLIEVDRVSKSFAIPSVRRETVREHLFGVLQPRQFEQLTVLDRISFELRPGETLGIMGRNGSGKSTLLKILCGIYMPDAGEVRVHAGITPILELGVGWNPELDAVDNVFLIGAVMGLSLRQVERQLDDILQFAEVERFARLKLKHYSSGMASRLAYAVAFHAVREVLVLDEIFAVGDAGFRSKCESRYQELRRAGHAVILVSHDPETVSRICERALLIEHGRAIVYDDADTVARRYTELLADRPIGSSQRLVSSDIERSGSSVSLARRLSVKAPTANISARPVHESPRMAAADGPFAWEEIVEQAVTRWRTPFFVAAWEPVRRSLEELEPLESLAPTVRHWLSVKTHPVRPLLETWRRQTRFGVEVVSEFELLAALKEGFSPAEIVVNGLGKHRWLRSSHAGLRLHLDSLLEVGRLSDRVLNESRLGVRCAIPTSHDPSDLSVGGQFGMSGDELGAVMELLNKRSLSLEGVHFHLKSSIREPSVYATALGQALSMANTAGLRPQYVDCGGGLAARGEAIWENGRRDAEPMSIASLARALMPVLEQHPYVSEIWFENGRFLTSGSAVLVLQVTDVKERDGCRYVLCDGGRTNQALPSDWEDHDITTLPVRSGESVRTAVCGPTCTAYDRLVCRPLPSDITPGDYIIWHNAGAYHLSWETRFSHGLAAVLWCDEHGTISEARSREDFESWWQLWN